MWGQWMAGHPCWWLARGEEKGERRDGGGQREGESGHVSMFTSYFAFLPSCEAFKRNIVALPFTPFSPLFPLLPLLAEAVLRLHSSCCPSTIPRRPSPQQRQSCPYASLMDQEGHHLLQEERGLPEGQGHQLQEEQEEQLPLLQPLLEVGLLQQQEVEQQHLPVL